MIRLLAMAAAAMFLAGCVGTVGLYGVLKPPPSNYTSPAEDLEGLTPKSGNG